MFRIVVPLDNNYSYDVEAEKSVGIDVDITIGIMNETRKKIIELMTERPSITAKEIAESIEITQRRVESNISQLKAAGIIERTGTRKNGHWVVKQV